MRAASRMWQKATASRSTLSHLYRRHLRYYSVFECAGRGGGEDGGEGGGGEGGRGESVGGESVGGEGGGILRTDASSQTRRRTDVCLLFKDGGVCH